jgi:signal transduction histidine kinase
MKWAPDPRQTGPGYHRPVILIVDDVASNLLALGAVLRRDDIEIATAISGRAALDILLEREVAVAILDVQMPEMDGFELATLMRSVGKTHYVPIIFLTAGSSDGERVFQGYESGAVDYLFKPVDARILRSKVDVFVTLSKQREQLRQADRMRELFIGILGHDLRNPLSGILMAAELIQLQAKGDADICESAQSIQRSGARMGRMIEQLLDVSRLHLGGGMTLSPRSADLEELTRQVLTEFDNQRPRFRVDILGATSGTWDADQMLRVLSNLIGNAVRHSPPDTPISILIRGEGADRVDLEVHNHGPPIPDELRPVLFEPFRGTENSNRRSRGLGLGLYIVKEIIAAHDGKLEFDTDPEAGTRFIVSLPRVATRKERISGNHFRVSA